MNQNQNHATANNGIAIEEANETSHHCSVNVPVIQGSASPVISVGIIEKLTGIFTTSLRHCLHHHPLAQDVSSEPNHQSSSNTSISMSSSAATATTAPHPPHSQNNTEEGEEDPSSTSTLSTNKTIPTSNTTPVKNNPSCITCNSTRDVEEDGDNPGDYYCKVCWEVYDESGSSQGGDSSIQPPHDADGNKLNVEVEGGGGVNTTKTTSCASPPASQYLTPRLSLNTQAETEASLTATQSSSTTSMMSPSQCLPQTQGGASSLASLTPASSSQPPPPQPAMQSKEQEEIFEEEEEEHVTLQSQSQATLQSQCLLDDTTVNEAGEDGEENNNEPHPYSSSPVVKDMVKDMDDSQHGAPKGTSKTYSRDGELSIPLPEKNEDEEVGEDKNVNESVEDAKLLDEDLQQHKEAAPTENDHLNNDNDKNSLFEDDKAHSSGSVAIDDEIRKDSNNNQAIDKKQQRASEEEDVEEVEEIMDTSSINSKKSSRDNNENIEEDGGDEVVRSPTPSIEGDGDFIENEGEDDAKMEEKEGGLLDSETNKSNDNADVETAKEEPIMDVDTEKCTAIKGSVEFADNHGPPGDEQQQQQQQQSENNMEDAVAVEGEGELNNVNQKQEKAVTFEEMAEDNDNHNDNDSEDEEDDWMCTQEYMVDKDHDGSGTLGLLTQAAESDEDDEDNSDAGNDDIVLMEEEVNNSSTNELGNNNATDDVGGMAQNIINSIDKSKGTTMRQPVMEAVTTNAHGSQDKHMTLSGLTEPTQSQNMLPRDKLPKFAAIGAVGLSSQEQSTEEVVNPKGEPLQSEGMENNEKGTEAVNLLGVNNEVDNNTLLVNEEQQYDAADDESAYKGLTEDDPVEEDAAAESAIAEEKTAGRDLVGEVAAAEDEPSNNTKDDVAESTDALKKTQTHVNERESRGDDMANGSQINETVDNDNQEDEEDNDDDDVMEGTGDTIVTTGSGSVGWSLYAGDTQQLPTGPSQLTHEPVVGTSIAGNNDGNVDEMENEGVPHSNAEHDGNDHEQSAVKKALDHDATGEDHGKGECDDDDDPDDPAYDEPTQKLDKPTSRDTTASKELDVEMEDGSSDPAPEGATKEEKLKIIHQQNHPMVVDNFKHTQENGSLPISYPEDHLPLDKDNAASPKKDDDDEPNGLPPPVDSATTAQGTGPLEEDDETQMSMDLLAASPAKANSREEEKTSQLHSKAKYQITLTESAAAQVESVEARAVAASENNNPSTNPKSPPRQEKAETKWMSSSRHLNGNNKKQDENESKESECNSSPRLLMPSFKSIQKNAPSKPTTLDQIAEDGSDDDDESWVGNGHNYDHSDPIENTQDDHGIVSHHPSAFKRLSRGTSSRSSCRHDDSSSKFSSTSTSNEMQAKANVAGSEAKSILKPKVLRYGALVKHPADKDEDRSVSSGDSDSSQEAEFDDDDNAKNASNFPQSQSEQRIMEQLLEVQEMASHLPSAEEWQEMVSRKELSDEIAELKKSHKAAIQKLQREKTKLKTQLKRAEETVNSRDATIKQMNAQLDQKKSLLNQQFAVIEQLKERAGGIAAYKNSSSAAKHTPPPTNSTNKKKRKKDVEKKAPGLDSDSSEDSCDEAVLSSLKKKKNDISPTSKTKKRRKSYGSRGQAVKANSPKPAAKAPTKAGSKSLGDTSSVDTSPISNRSTTSGAKKRGSSIGKKKRVDRALSPPHQWKQLQQVGWKYQTGPQPFNKVYVPKDGATHAGTQLGIHFFDRMEDAFKAAVARGDFEGSFDSEAARQKNMKDEEIEWHHPENESLRNDAPMDDSNLSGKMELLTLATAQTAIATVANFIRQDDRFISSCFNPIWTRLKVQGAEHKLSWRYEPYRDPLATKSWCLVPSNSTLAAKGVQGRDYFLQEEELVLTVLKEVSTMKEVSHLYAENVKSFDAVLNTLTRAVDEKISYSDAKLGKSASVRTRRSNTAYQPGEDSPAKSATKGKTSQQKKGQKQSTSKKRASKITPESSSIKKQKTVDPEEDTSPSFHASQTQDAQTTGRSFTKRSPGPKDGPLKDFKFFYSGIDPKYLIVEKIERLGGMVVQHKTLTADSAHRKAIFLSEPGSWRKMKYIFATSLGVPMLHYKWLEKIAEKYAQNGAAKVFDSELFIKYRLPLGLDLSMNVYPLQRASNARSWDPPGRAKGLGETVFEGMTIALAVDPAQAPEWSQILTVCGATVKTLSDVQKSRGTIDVDCCLFDPISLPPHVVSQPTYVSNLMKSISSTAPRLDLAWAHQSIIQRKCLPLNGDDRYNVTLEYSMNTTCIVSSIKRKETRYEVGDLVQFRRDPKSVARSRGRITRIIFNRQEKSCKLEIQLLESNGGYDLVDCSSSVKIAVNENCVEQNILMMGAKDFYKLGYLPENAEKGSMFNQYIPTNESQVR